MSDDDEKTRKASGGGGLGFTTPEAEEKRKIGKKRQEANDEQKGVLGKRIHAESETNV